MKKALVVDDTKNIRTLLETFLEIENYSVTSVENGEKALEYIKSETFNIIFLDIKMRKMSGTYVLQEIRNLGILSPVVIMTAFPTIKNAIECTKLGVVAYIQKPFSQERLKKIMDNIEEYNKKIIQEFSDLLKEIKSKIYEEKYSESYNLIKKALSIYPEYAELYYLLSIIYGKTGDSILCKKYENIYNILNN